MDVDRVAWHRRDTGTRLKACVKGGDGINGLALVLIMIVLISCLACAESRQTPMRISASDTSAHAQRAQGIVRVLATQPGAQAEGARRMLQHISPSPRQISTPDPASQVIEGGYNINEATPPPPGRQ